MSENHYSNGKRKYGRGHRLTPEEKEASIQKRKQYMRDYHTKNKDKLAKGKSQAVMRYVNRLREIRDKYLNLTEKQVEIVFID